MFRRSVAIYLNDAQVRNFQKWDILGNYVWPNYYVGSTYVDELDFFKNWIGDRLLWIDNNLPGNCISLPPVSVNNFSNNSRLLKIVDALGREVSPSSNTTLFYIYDDGTVQKKLFVN